MQETDLGVIQILAYYAAAVKKGNKVLGITRKGITSKTENVIVPTYKSMVCQHLEYYV